jgi:hypothetical protein
MALRPPFKETLGARRGESEGLGHQAKSPFSAKGGLRAYILAF